MAELAFPVHDIHLRNIKVCSAQDLSMAGRTKRRIVNVAGDISDINIGQAIFLCNLMSRFQG